MFCDAGVSRSTTLHHLLKSELLEAMKDCLRDLENVKLISPADLDIIDEKRVLRHKIDELEIEERRWT